MQENKLIKSFSYERIENLMLFTVMGDEPHRTEALQELKKRRRNINPELSLDSYSTNLGVVS